VFITDVHSLGLATAQGLIVTNTFYWDQNDQTRAFSKRFEAVTRAFIRRWCMPASMRRCCIT
jgi:branched-chain amino acid transport system substrate-binding protein